jgi:molybdenum cofactor biosynthesis enzyme MoaA
MTKTFCPYAWTHLSASTDGYIRLCCNGTDSDPRIKDENGNIIHIADIENIQDTFNTQMYKDIRKKMVAGETVDFCQRCYDVENNGGWSIRNNAVKHFGIDEFVTNTDSTGHVKNIEIRSLDLSWSNYCNLKCKMCSPDATNQLVEEYIHFGESYREVDLNKWTFDALYDTLETVSPNLTEILVTGGEPLLNKDFLKYIDYLVEKDYANDIILTFHTNLTIMPSRFMERFGKFKHTQIHISIDGTEDTYEYIRYPGKWSVVKRNINKLAEYVESANNIGAEAHVVFQSYNMHNICDLLRYFNKFKSIKNFETTPYFINAYHPWHSSIDNVPLKYRKKYVKRIKTLVEKLDIDKTTHFYGSLQNCLAMVSNKKTDNKDFIEHVKSRDAYRKQDAFKILPWIKDV